MTTCSLLLVTTGPLKTLAYANQLNLLIRTGLAVYVTDMVINELKAGMQYPGNKKAFNFINSSVEQGVIKITLTGVPERIAKYEELDLDPGEESIRVILKRYAQTSDDYALLLFEEDELARKTMLLPDNVYLITTRPFIQEFASRKIIPSAEEVLKEAERVSAEAYAPRPSEI